MNLSDFDFSVPTELIAKHPLKNRDGCRLLVLEKERRGEARRPFDFAPLDYAPFGCAQGLRRGLRHRQFADVLEYLQPGDVLVLNEAKVNKSRFFATRPSGGKVEILLTRPVTQTETVFVGAGFKPARGGRGTGLKPAPTGQTQGEAVGAGPSACPGGEGQPQGVAPTEKTNVWEAILSHSARVKEGEFLALNGNGRGEVSSPAGGGTPPLQQNGDGFSSPPRVGEGSGERSGFRILSKQNNCTLVQIESETDIFEKYGTIPIPPYLERPAEKEDEEDYQTVFAKTPGASAAPTAGLHFTPELLDKIKSKGVEIAYITLLVGPGTFEPIRGEDISQHKMQKEYFEIGEETCAKINAAKLAGKKIWAVGTTVIKALETAARNASPSVPLHQMEREGKNVGANFMFARSPLHPVERGHRGEANFLPLVGEGLGERLRPFSGDSDLFIHPPFDFQMVDGLITNFHWPRSTLILLVVAFAGKDRILSAYNEAIARRYRFFSYGDAMLIY